jgi:arylformamidase
MTRIIDISDPISPATAVWPGDTPFSAKWVMRMDEGASCNVSTVTMSVHCGTHTDAPYHFDPAGARIDEVDLRKYLGRCRVLEVRPEGVPPAVPLSALAPGALAGIERVLFKTRGSAPAGRFDEGFCSVGPAAADRIAAAGLALVGIDTPSMDHFTSKDLPSHRRLLAAGVAILENLDLSAVEPGDYELIALPLRIVGADSSPVRAVLRTIEEQR